MSDPDQKTFDPTPQRIEQARRKGDVPAAPEMRHAAMFAAMLVGVAMLGAHFAAALGEVATTGWSHAGERSLDPRAARGAASHALMAMLGAIGPLLIVTLIAAVAAGFAPGLPSLSAHRLRLKWDGLSPRAGARRLFGRQAWVEFARMLAKFGIVAVILAWVAWPGLSGLDRLVGAGAGEIGRHAAGLVLRMLRTVALLVGALAVADLLWQRRAWFARLRMSLQEVKDEHKDSDGDTQIKARIRAIAAQRARSRMMAAVPDASVVVTNPTHYAVALRYDHGDMRAPVVVAKGVDAVAARIREVAAANAVPVMESPPLARALYAAVEIGQPIRVEHYAAVAEIIGYVMRVTRGAQRAPR